MHASHRTDCAPPRPSGTFRGAGRAPWFLALALGLLAPLPAHAANPPSAAASAAAAAAAAVAATEPATVQLPTISIGNAVEGFRAPPPHAFRLGRSTMREDPGGGLAAQMARHLPGVSLTHEQGNALQPSLHFNGFAASPLLGTPQGLSVFQDGVRVNEPFGDTVNWDMVPMNAIASVNLVPIADPVYGLNSLGGAVLLRTLDGISAPGGVINLRMGSFGHTSESARYGSTRGDWSWLFAASNRHDDGFAPYNPSSDRTLFAKATRDAAGNHLDISYTFAQSHLGGSQTLPVEWMNTPTDIYSVPDSIDNQLNLFNIGDSQRLGAHWQLAGRVYLRNSDQAGFNSNVNGSYTGGTPTLSNPIANNVRNGLLQQARGVTLALHNDAPLHGMRNAASLGLDLARQTVEFTQAQQAATITPYRYVLGVGPFDQSLVDLGVTNRYDGLYLTDKLSPTHWLDVSAGARWDRAHIDMVDHRGGALGGVHDYHRLNPSLGLDVHPDRRQAYYLRYAEGMRVPMPVELTCASAAAPCTLPNVLVADPSLAPVVAHSAQAGTVWRLGWLRIQAQYTRTRLDNAVQFISLSNMTQGYFTNIPHELLRTASVNLLGLQGRWQWSLSLSHTLATYESAFQQPSPNNSSADASGNIQVRPGDSLPNTPRWAARVAAQYRANARWRLRGSMQAYGPRYAQGDENNRDVHGPLGSFAVFDIGADYRPARHWSVDLSVHNLFNRVYADFAQLGSNEFTGPGRSFSSDRAAWTSTSFVAPGAPRGIWLGLRYSWS